MWWYLSLEDKNATIPEIYVDRCILKNCGYSEKNYEISPIFDKVYEIEGRFYREFFKEDNKRLEYEIVVNKKTMNKSKIKEKYLDLDIELTNYGIVINSNILVPKDHWHTILTTGEDLMCFVCDSLVDSMEHTESNEHTDKLKNCMPLKRFDLSIVRQIHEHYHCGICNEIFHKNNENDHFKQKTHEQNMLYATNRASDVLSDFGLHDHKLNMNNENIKEYHFDRNKIYRDNSSENRKWESHSQYSEKENQYLENRNQYLRNGFSRNFRNSNSECQDPENPNEYWDNHNHFSESSDGFYEYDYNNDNDMEIDGNHMEGFSYASMAKKPAVTPKYIDAGDFKVKFDSWHMVNELKENKYYCIVCNKIGHISQKARHCMEKRHFDKVNKCKVVGKYKKCFIRQVGNNYHCALCNQIQPIFDIDDHLQSFHKNIHSKIDVTTDDEMNQETNLLQIPTNQNQKLQESSTTPESFHESGNDGIPKLDLSNPIRIWRQEMEINNVDPCIYNDIIINRFNHCLRVSFLAFNVVLKRNFEYSCGICHLNLPERFMILHIQEKIHLERLNLTPFEYTYGINLIRRVNHLFHCTLCNVFYDNWHISKHLKDSIHIELLEKALKIGKPLNHMNPNHDSNQSIQNIPNTSKNRDTNFNIPKNLNLTSNTSKPSDSNADNQKIHSKNQSVESSKTKAEVGKESENRDEKDSLNKTDLNASIESEESMDSYNHDYIYLQLKTSIIKVTYNAYHSLVPIGDGSRYCFLCSIRVMDVKSHIESREHIKCMECKFLDKYDKHFLRQLFHQYHCSVCNVIFSKKYLSSHLSFNPKQENMKMDKKTRKKDFKLGIQLRNLPIQKETIYLGEIKSKIDIIGQIDLRPKAKNPDVEIKKKNKLVIIGGNVLKVSWDAWQGLVRNKDGLFCLLCERDINNYDMNYHVNDERHVDLLEGTIDRKSLPHLLRQINDSTLNCVVCNMTFKKHSISEHLSSKKHNNKIISSSSPVESYTDCHDDVLYL